MSDSAVHTEVIEQVAKEYDVSVTVLSNALVSESIDSVSDALFEAIEECYRLQELRNDIGEKLQSAAEDDSFVLIDGDGAVFWVDEYDGFGAYIHMDEGNTHYVSLSRIADAFEFGGK